MNLILNNDCTNKNTHQKIR